MRVALRLPTVARKLVIEDPSAVATAMAGQFIASAPKRWKGWSREEEHSIFAHQASGFGQERIGVYVLDHVQRNNEIKAAVGQRGSAYVGLDQCGSRRMFPGSGQQIGTCVHCGN